MNLKQEIYVYDKEYTYLQTMPIYQFCQLYKIDIRDIPIYLDKKHLIFNYFRIKTQYVSVIRSEVSDDEVNTLNLEKHIIKK